MNLTELVTAVQGDCGTGARTVGLPAFDWSFEDATARTLLAAQRLAVSRGFVLEVDADFDNDGLASDVRDQVFASRAFSLFALLSHS